MACVTLTATCWFPLNLMRQKISSTRNNVWLYFTQLSVVVHLFCLKMNSPRLYLVVCSYCNTIEVCSSFTHKQPCCCFCFFFDIFVLFCFFPKQAKCISVSWVASCCTLNIGITISQKTKKIFLPVVLDCCTVSVCCIL